MTRAVLVRERRRNESLFDLSEVVVDMQGHPIVWTTEPDPESRDHFYVTYLRGARS